VQITSLWRHYHRHICHISATRFVLGKLFWTIFVRHCGQHFVISGLWSLPVEWSLPVDWSPNSRMLILCPFFFLIPKKHFSPSKNKTPDFHQKTNSFSIWDGFAPSHWSFKKSFRKKIQSEKWKKWLAVFIGQSADQWEPDKRSDCGESAYWKNILFFSSECFKVFSVKISQKRPKTMTHQYLE